MQAMKENYFSVWGRIFKLMYLDVREVEMKTHIPGLFKIYLYLVDFSKWKRSLASLKL